MIPQAAEKYIYYQEKDITLLWGDCLEILPLFEPGSIDMVMTSPPYDNLRDYEGYNFDFEKTAMYLSNVLACGGVIIWVVGDATNNGSETGTSFRQALYFKDNCGLNIHDTMLYAKTTYAPLTHNRYEQQFEYMFNFSKGKPTTFNPILEPCIEAGRSGRGSTKRHTAAGTREKIHKEENIKSHKIKSNIFYYDGGKNKGTKQHVAFEHPAKFPDQLPIDQIKSWSNTENTILDPFLGSGTTAVAAKQLGRKCIGIEIEKKYLDIAIERLRQEVLF